MTGRARKRAAMSLDASVELFARAGYQEADRPGDLEARVAPPIGGPGLLLRMVPDGRIFGGAYGLEISTTKPVLPRTRGLRARGRGVVRMSGVSFRARRSDSEGARLAKRLGADRGLSDALGEVHFERIRVEPDGRPVIRHMGGSVVWLLFPPMVRPVPLVEAQARAAARALEEFARAGRDI